MNSTYIGCNKWQFYGKLISSFIFIPLFIFFFFFGPLNLLFKENTLTGIFLLFLWSLIAFFVILMLFQLLFWPKGVEINSEDKLLKIKFFLSATKTLSIKDIDRYVTTKISTRSTLYEGVLIYTSTNRKFIFSDANLSDYRPVRDFLTANEIQTEGHEKYDNLGYFGSYFKK
ncbi:MAG: hypothetical protein EKK37_03410 [Sphingobacteriales bacterium]|nr:MAG: hypothetical protein EKK37_03410 [Sphingobacteriales bacterium]